MRCGPADLEAARNRARNGRPENVAKAGRRNGVEGTASERKRGTEAGRMGPGRPLGERNDLP
ncbi:MAG: hypothetical protein LBQ79_10675 [Deltaproteobacteria bacterium]|jgi:hypothetical protein|nr:hypothetical protein [Deltaproteobacteria bacterium]